MTSSGPVVWSKAHALVTGGASFIGSHLVDQLVARGARVRVVDDLTSGRRENLAAHLPNGRVEFIQADLRESGCGVVANPDEPSSIVAAVRSLLADREKLAAMGRRAREAAPQFEQRKHLALFVKAVESAVSPARSMGG